MKPAPQTVITQAEFAKRLRVDRQRVTKLIDAGIITRRPDGRLNLEDSLARASVYLKSQAEATALHSGRTALQARRLLLQCELLQVELDRERGKVHAKDGCAAATIAIYSAMRQVLLTLASRVTSQAPELGIRLQELLDREVDILISQLRGICDTDVKFFCPKCGHEFETLKAIIAAETRPPDSKFLGETQITVEQKQEEQKNEH
jgi:hypothetical protein